MKTLTETPNVPNFTLHPAGEADRETHRKMSQVLQDAVYICVDPSLTEITIETNDGEFFEITPNHIEDENRIIFDICELSKPYGERIKNQVEKINSVILEKAEAPQKIINAAMFGDSSRE